MAAAVDKFMEQIYSTHSSKYGLINTVTEIPDMFPRKRVAIYIPFFFSVVKFFIAFLFTLVFSFPLLHQAIAQNKHQTDSLIQILPQASAQEKAEIWATLSYLYSGKSPDLSRQYADSAITLTEQTAHPLARAKAFTYLGYYHMDVGDFEKAVETIKQGLSIDKETGNKKGAANQLNALAHIYMNQQDYEQALHTYQEALLIEKEIENPPGISSKLHNLGIVYQFLDMYPEAISYFLQALSINEEHDFPSKSIINLKQIGWIYLQRGDHEQALPYLKKALNLSEILSDNYQKAALYDHLGLLKFKVEDTDSARYFYENALTIALALNNNMLTSTILANLSDVYSVEGNKQKAMELLQESVGIQEKLKDAYNMSIGYRKMAELEMEDDNLTAALALAIQAEQLASEAGARKPQADASSTLADIYFKTGDPAKAYQFLQTQMRIKDTLHREEREKRFEELEIRYQSEKKQQEIQELHRNKLIHEARAERATLLRNFSIGSLFSLLLIGFLFFRQRKISQRVRENELAQQLKIEQIEAERLHEIDQMKSRFFANIAHEFRTPLTLIAGPVENLLEKVHNLQDKELLHLVKQNADRLLRLINQIMDLSRLESGLMRIQEEATEAPAFFKGLVYSFQSLAEQKNIELQFESELPPCQLILDKDKVEKIMTNLLSNAFKFTSAAGLISVVLQKESKEGQDFLKVDVSDTGQGISSVQLDKIFDRFFQVDNAGLQNDAGSGVGLALTKELVDLFGGSIRVSSEEGTGSTFSFSLPMILATNPNADGHATEIKMNSSNFPAAVAERPASEEMPDQEKELILIIEDNEDVRRFIRQSINPHYRVVEAVNGREGVEKALEEIPNLIISDVMMPEMDGYQVCRMIKEDEKTSHIPVILLTAKAGMEHKLEGLNTGADDYLAKPFHTKELLARIRNLIRIRSSLKQKYLSQVLIDKPEGTSREEAFLKKLREVVESHLDEEEFSIEDLSREVGMSRTQVHRKLKALTNQSASQFMRTIRLNQARRMLLETDFNISEIAYQVGFSSLSYFTKCFGEQFGEKPSDLKQIKPTK